MEPGFAHGSATGQADLSGRQSGPSPPLRPPVDRSIQSAHAKSIWDGRTPPPRPATRTLSNPLLRIAAVCAVCSIIGCAGMCRVAVSGGAITRFCTCSMAGAAPCMTFRKGADCRHLIVFVRDGSPSMDMSGGGAQEAGFAKSEVRGVANKRTQTLRILFSFGSPLWSQNVGFPHTRNSFDWRLRARSSVGSDIDPDHEGCRFVVVNGDGVHSFKRNRI